MPFFILAFLLILTALARAEVKLNPLFSDHMVLQRDGVVPVWGTASPGEKVTVEFAGQKVEATADENGAWRAELAPLKASPESRDLVVSEANTVTVKDVVVGDVWLAGGQSNMDSPLRSGSAAAAVPESADPLMRFFNVKKEISIEPQTGVTGKWEISSPETSPNFSAVAWFFAREIRQSQGVPIGVISAPWGGTPIKTWMGLDMFKLDPPLEKQLAEWNDALAKHEAVKDQPQLLQDYYRDMQDWEQNVQAPYKAAMKTYNADVAAARAAGQPAPEKPQLSRPEPVMPDPLARPAPSKRPSVPSHAYNAMIAPLIPYGIKGLIWYQGEADVSRADEYRQLFPRFISAYRALWGRGDFPVLFVQLPGNGKDEGNSIVSDKGIALLRDAQASVLSMPETGMAVTIDIGDAADVHPDNKIHVGRRLSLVAREKVYGESVSGTGPMYQSHEVKDGAVHVRFDNTGSGLVIGEAPWRVKGSAPLPTDKLVGFAICGADGKWVEADARIEGGVVILSNSSLPEPVGVAYGWSATPSANLYNSDNLPAAPFRKGPGAP